MNLRFNCNPLQKINILICTLFLLGAFVFSSCNNKPQKPAEESKKPTPPPAAITSLEQFPILYAQASEITNTFNAPPGMQVRKIVFQFNFDGGASQPTLVGFQAKQNGKFLTTSPVIVLQKANAATVTLNYPLNLGNIEFTRAEYTSLMTDPQNPPQQYLIFIPMKSMTYPNFVTYKTAWSSAAPPFTAAQLQSFVGDELKPSPPADPYF